jgi:hypothetical protein
MKQQDRSDYFHGMIASIKTLHFLLQSYQRVEGFDCPQTV